RCLSDWSSDVCSSDLSQVPRDFGFLPRVRKSRRRPRVVGFSPARRYTLRNTFMRRAIVQPPRFTISFVELKQNEKFSPFYFQHRSEERRVGKECIDSS